MVTATMLPTRLQGPAQPLVRVMTRPMAPKGPRESKDPKAPKTSSDSSDLLVTLDAEDAFDVRDELHRITAPTLVIGGGKDVFYTRELFEETAAGVKDGRAHISPGWGHNRTCMSSTTTARTLGFFLAAPRD
ncbi:MAG TPA: alpha/beta hydrolase [Ornithinibacter sp.]|nr:alpha/beta hydrolase [Ornithinibacter sp.]